MEEWKLVSFCHQILAHNLQPTTHLLFLYESREQERSSQADNGCVGRRHIGGYPRYQRSWAGLDIRRQGKERVDITRQDGQGATASRMTCAAATVMQPVSITKELSAALGFRALTPTHLLVLAASSTVSWQTRPPNNQAI